MCSLLSKSVTLFFVSIFYNVSRSSIVRVHDFVPCATTKGTTHVPFIPNDSAVLKREKRKFCKRILDCDTNNARSPSGMTKNIRFYTNWQCAVDFLFCNFFISYQGGGKGFMLKTVVVFVPTTIFSFTPCSRKRDEQIY